MRCALKSATVAVLVSAALLAMGPPARGEPIYLSIPSIKGEDPTPGYPGAMLVNSLTIVPDGFSIMKAVDKATPQINAAVVKGTPLGTVDALLYNTAPSGSPDAILPFANVLASSQSISASLIETDTFAATTPHSMYLEVLGITASSSTPGFTGLMQIDSLEISGNAFTVQRDSDAATPQILTAIALGTVHTAKLLFYDGAPTGPPDTEVDFQHVIASSYMPLSGGDVSKELDTFDFDTLSQPPPPAEATPEPGSFVLALLGGVLSGGCCLRKLRRNRRTIRAENVTTA
jgi:type VI protein secretion system component Hcp